MEPQDVAKYLKAVPLFADLTGDRGEPELYRIVSIVLEKTYEDGEWLFGQGESAEGLYIILEGQVRLTQVDSEGVTRQVGMKGPGSVFGEMGLLVGDFHDVTAESLGKTNVLLIRRQEFAKVCQERPYLRQKLNIGDEVAKRLTLPQFDWLREDEGVIFSVQRHWAQLVRKGIPPLLVLLLLLPVFYSLALSGSDAAKVGAVVMAFPLVGLVLFIGWTYLNWRDDYFVLTTQRVVHFERVWPISESFEESALQNVVDIYEVRPGLSANILNYGSLVLQTMGETVQIDMSRIPNPGYLREVIFREIDRYRARELLRSRGAIRDVLARRLNITGAQPPEPPPPVVEKPRPFLPAVLAAWVWEYFFPPTWSISEDGSTIIWRRFWVPGFVHYLKLIVPLIVLTIGGILVLLSRWERPEATWLLIVWLSLEAVLFAILLWFIEDWRNDYFQLTPNRVVLVERRPLLLQETRKEAQLDRIQNISFEVPGVLARVLRYGHVMLETAGTMGKFELKWLRHPQRVQSEISKRQREFAQRQREGEARRRQEELLSWFTTYDNLRGRASGPSARAGTEPGGPPQS